MHRHPEVGVANLARPGPFCGTGSIILARLRSPNTRWHGQQVAFGFRRQQMRIQVACTPPFLAAALTVVRLGPGCRPLRRATVAPSRSIASTLPGEVKFEASMSLHCELRLLGTVGPQRKRAALSWGSSHKSKSEGRDWPSSMHGEAHAETARTLCQEFKVRDTIGCRRGTHSAYTSISELKAAAGRFARSKSLIRPF